MARARWSFETLCLILLLCCKLVRTVPTIIPYVALFKLSFLDGPLNPFYSLFEAAYLEDLSMSLAHKFKGLERVPASLTFYSLLFQGLSKGTGLAKLDSQRR